ncbi:MAG: type I DNA topoisomerase [Patescibacteria group bacterium]
MNLIIVESPTKAKTISNFLTKDFKIESSFGHVRDLPKTKLGVDVNNNFKPTYVIPDKAKDKISKIANLAKKARAIYYATDEDREGEAIAWHLDQILTTDYKLQTTNYRIAFHEITKEAILEALRYPRSINIKLVDAQQARRILDRLVGYKLSPFLWKKVMRGLSAGRVQSVAVRLIVEREEEIKKFKPQEYWTIEGIFNAKNHPFPAVLHKLDNKQLKKFDLKSQKQVQKITENLKKLEFSIADIKQKEIKKNPYPPYKTSTLQQDAYIKLGFSSKQTMMIAQQLYETGHITYMRTDSLNLANKFLVQAQKYLKDHLGSMYCLKNPRTFKTKSKGAQEAHEAIRPTNVSLTPESIKQLLEPKQFKLYLLIWQRSLCCQMPQAIISQKIVEIEDSRNDNNKISSASFRTIGNSIKFDGFLKIYHIKIIENELPELKVKQKVNLEKLTSAQHQTSPPPRFNDASLVKELEKRGIGRPSTYAPIIDTIQKRNYIQKDDQKRFQPTEIGTLVNQLLVEHFPEIVDYAFTAEMEDNLDNIAKNSKAWDKVIGSFYKPFAKNLADKYKKVDKKTLTQEKTNKKCPGCKKHNLIIKLGRFGKFLACPGFPDCKHTEPLVESDAYHNNKKTNDADPAKHNSDNKIEIGAAPQCEKCQTKMILKEGRFGKFWACPNYPNCKNTQRIEQKIGLHCPQCQKGEIIIKRTKKGKMFYGCNKYPDCKYASWKNPQI